MHPYVYCSIIYNSQDMEATQLSISGQINLKRCGAHTHTHTHSHTQEHCVVIQKDEILLFATTRMDLESIMSSEISQTKKEMPHDFNYLWNIKNKTNK